jgi:hypothetical protein
MAGWAGKCKLKRIVLSVDFCAVYDTFMFRPRFLKRHSLCSLRKTVCSFCSLFLYLIFVSGDITFFK